MASMTLFRGYHSTAVLLPDGRVLSAGGQPGPGASIGNASAEIYSPPYLFHGSRPTITSAPTSVGYGQSFFVGTPDATSISKVTLIALSSVTHGFNMGQRIGRPLFSQATGGVNVTAPSDPNKAPPGYYMLFILKSNGVPSVAKIVQINSTTPPNPNPYVYPEPLSDTNPNSHGNTYPDPDSAPNSKSYRNSNTSSYAHCDPDPDADSNPNSYADADANAKPGTGCECGT